MTLYTEKRLHCGLSLVLVFGLIVGIIAGIDGSYGQEGGNWGKPGPGSGHNHSSSNSTSTSAPVPPTVPPCGADNSPCRFNSCCCSGVCNMSVPSYPGFDLRSWPHSSSSSSSEEDTTAKPTQTGVCVKNCTGIDETCSNDAQCCPTNDPSNTTAICMNGKCQETPVNVCKLENETCSVNSECCNSDSNSNPQFVCSNKVCKPCVQSGDFCSSDMPICCTNPDNDPFVGEYCSFNPCLVPGPGRSTNISTCNSCVFTETSSISLPCQDNRGCCGDICIQSQTDSTDYTCKIDEATCNL